MTNPASEMAEIHWLIDALQNVDIGLTVLDRNYSIQLWNGFMENHSGLRPADVQDRNFLDTFSEVDEAWLKRKIDSVFLLKAPQSSTWEQRPYLLKFKPYRPVTGKAKWMYQNTTIFPLISSDGSVNHVCIIIYDVTDIATGKLGLEQANEQLARLSQKDGLTGLYNRATWETLLKSELLRSRRTGQPCSLVMLDIDHFKNINDTYGHQAGDEAIRALANMVEDQKRETDIAGRYGGEEFVVTLIDTSAENAQIFAERLRQKIEKNIIQWEDQKISYTVSLGISELTSKTESHESWIHSADKALYFSKENGRNRVTLAKK
jgi:diguanylate cyclase (GGDEF)-like protein/PAS domain S-box-containing protein